MLDHRDRKRRAGIRFKQLVKLEGVADLATGGDQQARLPASDKVTIALAGSIQKKV